VFDPVTLLPGGLCLTGFTNVNPVATLKARIAACWVTGLTMNSAINPEFRHNTEGTDSKIRDRRVLGFTYRVQRRVVGTDVRPHC
jgi:hypothetical protein